MKIGGFDGGIRAAEQIVARYPSSAPAHHNLGAFLYARHPRRAQIEFRRAINLDANYQLPKEALVQLTWDIAEGHIQVRGEK